MREVRAKALEGGLQLPPRVPEEEAEASELVPFPVHAAVC